MSLSLTTIWTSNTTTRYNLASYDAYDATGAIGGTAFQPEQGIYEYGGQRFQVCEKIVRATAGVNLYGRAYVSVFVSSSPYAAWSESDGTNAPEMLTGFIGPTGGNPIFGHNSTGGVNQTFSVSQLGQYLYVFYFQPILYPNPPGLTSSDPCGYLSVCRFNMLSGAWGTPDVSTLLVDRTADQADPSVTSDVELCPYSQDAVHRVSLISLCRSVDCSFIVIGNMMTVPDSGNSTFWARPCYARYVVDVGWVEAGSPQTSWNQLGLFGLDDKDYNVLSAAISTDNVVRLILGTLIWDIPTFVNPQDGNLHYQTIALDGTVSAPQDIGISPGPIFGSGALVAVGRPKCSDTEIAFPYTTQRSGGNGQDTILVARALLAGSSPTWSFETVDGPLPSLNPIVGTEFIANYELLDDLATLVYCVFIDSSPTYALRVFQRAGVTWAPYTPVAPLPVIVSDNITTSSAFYSELMLSVDTTAIQIAGQFRNELYALYIVGAVSSCGDVPPPLPPEPPPFPEVCIINPIATPMPSLVSYSEPVELQGS